MNEVVQSVVTAVEPLATEKKLALKVDGSARICPEPRATSGASRRCCSISPGTPSSSPKRARFGSRRRLHDDAFLVSVADTGPGIAEAEQQKIFEEFQQAESSSTRKKGGTGLGLVDRQAHRRAARRAHLGGIRSPGQGSTFRFTLPVRVERQREAR